MAIFGKDEKAPDSAPSIGSQSKSPPRVETIQGVVKALHLWQSGKVRAEIELSGGAGIIDISGQRFKIGESVKVRIEAED